METKSRVFIKAVFVAVVLASATSACSSPKGSTGAVGTGHTTAPAVTTTPSHLLRVSPLTSFHCPKIEGPPNITSVHPTTEIAPSAIIELLLCPYPDGAGTQVPAALSANTPIFKTLLVVLSEPDIPAKANQQCLAYANVPQIVVGRLATGAVLIEVPVDGCGHYEPDALNALLTARGNA